MKQFLAFLPLIVFFIIYKLYDIYYASGALIVASALILICNLLCYQKIEKVDLIVFVLVAVFGLLTLYYHNAEFIKWKVTVIYTLFTGALLINQFVLGNLLIQRMLDKKINLPVRVWKKLNIAWAVFFFSCGTANTYIAFWLSQNVWVNFKVFGLIGLTLVFILLNGIYIYRHRYIVEDEHNKNIH